MTTTIKRLKVEGLYDRQDVDVEFLNPISIFMGPNGVGKSTVLNVFVHTLSRQWQRLSKLPFVKTIIEFASGETVTVSRSDCIEFASIELPSRYQQIAISLVEEGRFSNLSKLDQEMRVMRSLLQGYPQAHQSLTALSTASGIIAKNLTQKLIYLPTYRRIEQDITEVLSISSLSMKRIQAEIIDATNQTSASYTELVRFGMEDIKKSLETYASDIKEYSRQQINSLSTKYLVAALKAGRDFDQSFFNSLSDARIRDILARVDDEELVSSQRILLTDLIKSLRERQGDGRLSRAQEHVADYFLMLAETHDRISSKESALQELARILNRYMLPSKQAFYDQTRYKFVIRSGDMDIPLSGLSSGEKQIVSLFVTLILNQEVEFFVVIDEPELSLSVLWQETLIEDIMSVSACRDLLAVTHSPFIYGQRLARYTRDLSDHTHMRPAQNG